MVTFASPELVTVTGTIRLLPTETLPKLVLGTENGLYTKVVVAFEIEESETSRRLQYTSLRGDPRRFMFSLSFRVLIEHAGDLVTL